MNKGDAVRIEYIRAGKDVAHYEEDFITQDETCLRTFKTLPEEISIRLSKALVEQALIQPDRRVGTLSKVYFFTEPFNLLEFRDLDGSLLGYYSNIGEPAS